MYFVVVVVVVVVEAGIPKANCTKDRKDWINTRVIDSGISFENNYRKSILFIAMRNKFFIGQSIKGSSEGQQSKTLLGKCGFSDMALIFIPVTRIN